METANFTGLMAPPDSIDYRSDYVLFGAKSWEHCARPCTR